ncbi:MAG: GspE/PulE family protein [Gallicola sp.]|nr:GspE/PulE family protein [Gallicola sp.]
MFLKKEAEDIVEENQFNIKELLDEIIIAGIEQQASDIHFEIFQKNLRIRFRIDGKLFNYRVLEKKYHSAVITRIKILSGMDIAEKRLPQDGRYTFGIDKRDVDMRVSSIPAIAGEKIVIRILDPIKFQRSVKDLGIRKEDGEQIEELLKYDNGIVILTGPTGCGKTTTLYSLLRELNQEEVNIVTIENPVEYKMEGVNQIQVHENIGLTFSSTLRSVLRQDPEIIMVGEIRDLETAQIAIRAAITGHRIFTTLHTNDSYSTIVRLLDMGIEAYLLKSSINGIISQRLVRKLCTYCKIKIDPNEKERELLKQFEKTGPIYKAEGCERCHGGYKGREAIMEILPIDQDFMDVIDERSDIHSLRMLGKQKEIRSLVDKGIDYVLEGRTSLEEVARLMVETE